MLLSLYEILSFFLLTISIFRNIYDFFPYHLCCRSLINIFHFSPYHKFVFEYLWFFSLPFMLLFLYDIFHKIMVRVRWYELNILLLVMVRKCFFINLFYTLTIKSFLSIYDFFLTIYAVKIFFCLFLFLYFFIFYGKKKINEMKNFVIGYGKRIIFINFFISLP